MLKKLFKYDFNAIKSIWWIVAATLPVISVVGALGLRAFIGATSVDSEAASVIFGILGMLVFFFSIIALFSSPLVTLLCSTDFIRIFTATRVILPSPFP